MDTRKKYITVQIFSVFATIYASYIILHGISTGKGMKQDIYLGGIPYSEVTLATIAFLIFFSLLAVPKFIVLREKWLLEKFKKEVNDQRRKRSTL